MTIFRNQQLIKAGVEIVAMSRLVGGMSTGVSYFEQFVWDLKQRGVGDIDVPVLLLGADDELGGHIIPDAPAVTEHVELQDLGMAADDED